MVHHITISICVKRITICFHHIVYSPHYFRQCDSKCDTLPVAMSDILLLADRLGVCVCGLQRLFFTSLTMGSWDHTLIHGGLTCGLSLDLCVQKSSKEPILEEAELDFRPLEECDEALEEEDLQPPETKETQNEAKREADRKEGQLQSHSSLDSYKPQPPQLITDIITF